MLKRNRISSYKKNSFVVFVFKFIDKDLVEIKNKYVRLTKKILSIKFIQ